MSHCRITGVAIMTVAILSGCTGLRQSNADDRIESAFQRTYAFQAFLKGDTVHVESEDGCVTLTGTVSDDSRSFLAQETAAGLPGVIRVDNRLKVDSNHPHEHSDAWVNLKVNSTLLFHRNVNASGTQVGVRDGVVTLRGEADSGAQKERTAEYARDVDGVKGVNNEMTVVSKPSGRASEIAGDIDDASITAQVKTVLLLQRSTSAIRTKVVTNDGVVTVSGKAKSDVERSLVTRLASDVRGVKRVSNDMTIE